MLSSLDSIPSAAWVVVGSLITLVGILLTNRGQDRRFVGINKQWIGWIEWKWKTQPKP